MALLGRLTAPEYLHFVGRMYGLDAATTNQRTEELLEFMQLAAKPETCDGLLARNAEEAGNGSRRDSWAKVLFLDEPFEGVDAIAAGMLKNMLTGMINAERLFFSPLMCWRLWSGCAVMWQSSRKGGWWPLDRSMS